MYGLEKCKGIKIDTANGSTSIVTHIGNYKGKVQCSDGTELIIIMKNVKVIPGLVKNLFLLSTVMRNDWDLLTETTDDTKVLKIKKNDVEYKFDKKVSQNSNGGYLMGMQIVPDKIDEKENGKDNNNDNKNKNIEKREKGNVIGAKIDINEVHEKLGHPEERVTKLTGNYMKVKIKGKMENCENCTIGK